MKTKVSHLRLHSSDVVELRSYNFLTNMFADF